MGSRERLIILVHEIFDYFNAQCSDCGAHSRDGLGHHPECKGLHFIMVHLFNIVVPCPQVSRGNYEFNVKI